MHSKFTEENFNKLLSENTALKSDNYILKNRLKENDKKYLKVIEEKDKVIKELKERISSLEYKQADIFGDI